METANYTKNPFNPMFGGALPGPGLTRKKNYEPFRNRSEIQKYQYVVDWQINENDTGNKPSQNDGNTNNR